MEDYRKFTNFFVLSVLAHIMIIMFFYTLSKTDLSWIGSVVQTKDHLKISEIKSAVRVDVVAMPKRTLQELKILEKDMSKGDGVFNSTPGSVMKEAPKAKIKDNKNDLVFKKVKKTKSFMSMLKNISKKSIDTEKKIKDKRKQTKKNGFKIGGKYEGELKSLVMKGNQLAKGGRLTGGGDGAEATVYNEYVLSLPDHVRPNWRLPSYLMKEEYKCRIRIYLRPSGDLIKASIFESSGSDEYDIKALLAAKSAAPYPVVPSEIRDRVASVGVVLGFPL